MKQAGRLFNKNLHQRLIALRFTQSQCDECLYFKTVNGQRIYVLVYVDDIIIASKDKAIVQSFKDELRATYKIVDRGPVECFLGIEVQRDRSQRKLWLGQTSYIRDVVKRFRLDDTTKCAPSAPDIMPSKEGRLTADMAPKTDAERAKMKKLPYRELVGSLNYIATAA